MSLSLSLSFSFHYVAKGYPGYPGNHLQCLCLCLCLFPLIMWPKDLTRGNHLQWPKLFLSFANKENRKRVRFENALGIQQQVPVYFSLVRTQVHNKLVKLDYVQLFIADFPAVLLIKINN